MVFFIGVMETDPPDGTILDFWKVFLYSLLFIFEPESEKAPASEFRDDYTLKEPYMAFLCQKNTVHPP